MTRVKLLAVTAACCALLDAGSSSTKQLLEVKRSSPSDLEITGVGPGTFRYISYEKLLAPPQATVTPAAFEAYLLSPKSNYHEASTRPGSRFDDATAKALQAYFQTFAPGGS